MWSKQQLACMDALGMPVYEFRGTVPVTTCSDTNLSEIEEVAHYRLGPWILIFPGAIPVASFDWLSDLAAFIGGLPVQVSHVPEGAFVIDCSEYAQNQLTSELKKALWNELKPALNS